uniref:ADAM metallopeptidase with thrombospondin type 1 motif, 2a n=1 Tax=Cynoglossus semilaevis TaxID=244447 RepID=A0A3P8WZF9_CYNSE
IIISLSPPLLPPPPQCCFLLTDFDIVQPIRTDSEGRVLPMMHLSHLQHRRKWGTPINNVRQKRQTQHMPPSNQRSGTWRGQIEGQMQLYYNITVFGQKLRLQLRPNSRLVAPTASMEWEESGQLHSEPIRGSDCLYIGDVANMEETSVAVSTCDGLAGIIQTPDDEFFIQPLRRRRTEGGGDEEGDDQETAGRPHVVYRASAVRTKTAGNQTVNDFLSGRTPPHTHLTELSCVLLAVDYSVLLFHGREHIQKFLLTFMNIVNEIYQDHSLGANINTVLVRIIMLSASKSLELISAGDPQKSLEKVCGWSYLQQREQSHAEQHDHTIYLTRQEFGPSGMQGYAPVTGMCQLHRSCVLVLEDGFSSAFVAAHETGHVLGMQHDGEANSCEDDVSLGSIMSPRVQATFHRYHWSRCSWRELHQYLDSYDCLRDDPFHHDWPPQPPLPGFQYSMDQQCVFDFGPGYSLCTAYPNLDPCKQLWCSDYNNPFYCKTKKGPPLDGTKCGPGKHCYRGFCLRLTPNLLKQDGGWGTWSSYGSCSRTCGGGVRFRIRRCDNPSPANGGRTCIGNSFEFELCSQDECPALTDFREEQCKVWNPFFEHEGTKHHWLPFEHPDLDLRCRLHCQSKETGAVVSMNRMVHDGTACSYGDTHSVCVRGECEHVGCDGQIASDHQEDRCGVCGGDNATCRIIKGNFTRSTKKSGYLKILEIPKGARHLLVQEFKGTPHILAVKNLETGHLFLNDDHEIPQSRVVIEKGVAWDYINRDEQEFLQTSGPLKYRVLLMVRSHGDTKVTVSYKYVIQERLRSSLESNLLQEDSVFYEWALKRWSQCSKPCGGGKQYTRFGCRRKADGKMVPRTLCSNVKKPRAISRSCNTDTCSTPRWVTGTWEDCSASCGQSGWQRRWVSCQEDSIRAHLHKQQGSSRGQQHSANSKLCQDQRPEGKRVCNRFMCPATWRIGPWTPCSVSCGNGTQERQVACSSPNTSTGNCTEAQPITTRSCQAPPCNGDQKNSNIQWLSRSNPALPAPKISSKQRCRGDRSMFCRMEALHQYCSNPGYRQMCCQSCIQTPHLEPSIPTPNSAGADPTHIPSASAGPENLVNSTLLGGQRWQIKVYPTDPSISSSSFIPQTKTENNSVDEVLYQIVEEDRDNTRRHQNYFVPRMPPFRERTQNKRIQQLLNEKRRQNLLKRVNHNKEK